MTTGHTATSKLLQLLTTVNVRVGESYYHYRTPSKLYKVIAVGLQEATENPAIVYQDNNGVTWIRDYDVWNSKVELEDGTSTARFHLVK